jgi:quercetin dioxygenase-like cupin family protein
VPPGEHWCYLAKGQMRYRFSDGDTLTARAGDAFHLRAGHVADVLEDAELIEFTSAEDYRRKAEHLASR